MVKIQFSMDRMGFLHMKPVNRRFSAAIGRFLKEWKIHWGGDVLVQEDYNIEAEMEYLSSSQRRDIENGWDVTIKMDPWDFLHRVGWDAHEGVRKW